MFSFKVRVPAESVFRSLTLQALASHLTQALNRATPGILVGVQEAVRQALTASQTFTSLNTGDLWHLLGLQSPDQASMAIVEAAVKSVQVQNKGVRAFGGDLRGGLVITALKSDFSEVLGIKDASFISPEYGYHIPWLHWLLLDGTKKVVADYTYISKATHHSRTGLGIMVESGRGWGLPSEWAGTKADNWITRSLETLTEPVAEILRVNLERNL